MIKLKKYSNLIISIIILALMFTLQTLILKSNLNLGYNALTLVINPILACLLGIVISKNKNLLFMLIGPLLITLLKYKEFFGYFSKYIIVLSVVYLALAFVFMITKTSQKRKYQTLIILSAMLISQFLIFNYTNFDNLEMMLSILFLIINPICSILLGIQVSKDKKLFWSLLGIVAIPIIIYIILFNERSFSRLKINQMVIIYSSINLVLALIIIICNKFIKQKKIKILVATILIVVLLVLAIFITNIKMTMNNIIKDMDKWYYTEAGKVFEINDKKIILQTDNSAFFSTSYSDFKSRTNIDINDLNIGDEFKYDDSYFNFRKSIIIKKDDERKRVEFESFYYKYIYLDKEYIRKVTDNSGKRIKNNEIGLNQEVKVLMKNDSLLKSQW